ncbi:MAG: DUF885 family protein [Hyphomonadaceae bacterium]|nr:MAG: hypothetical protein FD160_2547 [Caulobacteraceae bacterium]MBT9446616.1 DUF885 family protein [Hyphomonadaceae bacterium]TPW05415.1 MAG: hypothetical protein FD124_2158 [Alphaproteobacteria bacterium]
MTRALLLTIALMLAACSPKAEKPMSAFDGFVADATGEIVRDSPELATRAGLPVEVAGANFRTRLDDRSAIALDRRRTMALRLDAQLRGFDRAALDDDDQVTFDVLGAQFSAAAAGARFTFGRFSKDGFSPYVLNQLDSAFLTLPDFMDTRHEVKTLLDARDYVARLGHVALAIDAETERARLDAAAGITPPDFVIDRTLAALDAQTATPPAALTYVTALKRKLEAVVGPLSPLPPGAEAPKQNVVDVVRARDLLAQAETIVATKIQPAHIRAAGFLRSIRPGAAHDAGVGHLRDGGAYYAAALAQQTTTSLTPEEVHAIGLKQVQKLLGELDGALRVQGLTEGPPGQRLAQFSADPRFQYPPTDEGRAQLIADVNGRVQAIMARAPQWFGTLPKAKLEVRRVPLLLEASQSGAYYEAPSLDGAQPGVYYINLRDLAQMTKIDLPTQDYHEAAPGHHFQIALAQEQERLPLIRRIAGFNAFAEGWGLYAEQLVDEAGLYESDPVGRIGFLRWRLWRAARLVVDTGIHAYGWNREQAIAYLIGVTGDNPAVVTSEVERYAVWPGQACGYEIGRIEIERLREKAQRGLGPKFDLKTFHDVVLLNGSVPLTVLEAQIDRWITRAK